MMISISREHASPAVQLSVVMATYNRFPFLRLAVNSVRREMAGKPFEMIVVDGGSTDGTLKWLAKQRDIITIIQHNRGTWNGARVQRRSWGYFMNLGFKCAQGKYVTMLSDDSLVVPGAISNGIRRFEECQAEGRNVGAVAFYWRNWPSQQSYCVGLTLGNRLFVNHGMYLKEALQTVGYIDESFAFYHADGDLCLKLWQRGYICVDSPQSFVEHYYNATPAVRSTNMETQRKDWERYLAKWKGIYFDEEQDNIGGWIYREYVDDLNTAKAFRTLGIFAEQCKASIRQRCWKIQCAMLSRLTG